MLYLTLGQGVSGMIRPIASGPLRFIFIFLSRLFLLVLIAQCKSSE